MNKENTKTLIKCKYCHNQATGIIYKPKNQLLNVLSCNIHATNLFIPFKNNYVNQTKFQQSRYRSPMKKSFSIVTNNQQKKQNFKNPQAFFDKLMQNVIMQFNTMKKEVLKNYHAINNLQKNQKSIRFQIEGDPSYPYMIINNDQQMLMNTFINRILCRHTQQIQKQKRQYIIKRRAELSTLISSQYTPNQKLQDLKQVNSVILSRSVHGSPQTQKHSIKIDKSFMSTQRKSYIERQYSRTQKRNKNQI